MKHATYGTGFIGVIFCLLLQAVIAQAAADPCRTEAGDANNAAQKYRAAARDVGHICSMENGDCASAESEAIAALQNLLTAHQTMLNTCPTVGTPPPPPPPPSPTIEGDVFLTEFMVSPFCPGGEWFEVHNPTNGSFELQGLVIEGSIDDTPFTISNSLIIPAGGFAVFVNQAGANCITAPLKYIYDGTFFDLNTSDRIKILNGTVTINLVIWSNTGWPIANGRSTSLNPFFFTPQENPVGSHWCLSSSGYGANGETGTPGGVNDNCSS